MHKIRIFYKGLLIRSILFCGMRSLACCPNLLFGGFYVFCEMSNVQFVFLNIICSDLDFLNFVWKQPSKISLHSLRKILIQYSCLPDHDRNFCLGCHDLLKWFMHFCSIILS